MQLVTLFNLFRFSIARHHVKPALKKYILSPPSASPAANYVQFIILIKLLVVSHPVVAILFEFYLALKRTLRWPSSLEK